MTTGVHDWLKAGMGNPPRCQWSFGTEAPLVSLEVAKETGETLVGDESGGLSLLDRSGKLLTVSRGFQHLSRLAWSDTGGRGAAILGDSKLAIFDRRLRVEWSRTLREPVTSLAIDPHGQSIAVALANGENLVFGVDQARLAKFSTDRPLRFLKFLAQRAEIVAAAEYGLLCKFGIRGGLLWSRQLWSNVGDLTASGDGKTILLASFTHGVQRFDARGTSQGTFIMEGTPGRISVSEAMHQACVSTIEQNLYLMTIEGEMLWGATAPDVVVRVICDPLARFITCGLAGGRILRLAWQRI